MKVLLRCPKCHSSMDLDASLSGGQTECADCGQLFIVGEIDAELPVVKPHAILASVAEPEGLAFNDQKITPEKRVSNGEKQNPAFESRGRFVKGALPEGAGWQRRRCAVCNSAMSMSHGESKVLDFFVPIGSTYCWECERCGKEITVQSPKRILLMLLASPLIVGWWLVFSESSIHHDANAAWWKRAAEEFAPHDSKGSFWFILFLLLFAMAPLTLIREMIIRLRYPRIL